MAIILKAISQVSLNCRNADLRSKTNWLDFGGHRSLVDSHTGHILFPCLWTQGNIPGMPLVNFSKLIERINSDAEQFWRSEVAATSCFVNVMSQKLCAPKMITKRAPKPLQKQDINESHNSKATPALLHDAPLYTHCILYVLWRNITAVGSV